jgi:hypothetical protein
MRIFVVAALLLLVTVSPARAQSLPQMCQVVEQYGGTEIQQAGLARYTIYYLYVRTDAGWRAYSLNLGYGSGNTRFLLGQNTFDAYAIVTEDGHIVSIC